MNNTMFKADFSIKQWIYLTISFLMCLSGAVNVGWSKFYLAIPFALLLLFILRKNKFTLMFGVVFIFFCLTVNYTALSNPLIFPKLSENIPIENGCALKEKNKNYPASIQEYDLYITHEKINQSSNCEKFSNNNFNYIFVPSNSYKVVGVYTSAPDMSSRSNYIIDLHNGQKAVDSRIEAQSSWSKNLSLLMMYPAAPILVFTLF